MLTLTITILMSLISSRSNAFSTGDGNTLHLKTNLYISGQAALDKAFENPSYQSMIIGKYGFIEVPLDYSNLAAGKTSIFYRLPKNIDPSKPNLLFFYGGPGGNSTGLTIEDRLTDFNVIYFDQRGTGFSRPPKLEDLKNPEYFSSEFIAKDAKILIDFLGLKKVSIYGHSYGTVVATIFANLFAESVNAVVLEGVVFDGTSDLWINPDRLRSSQSFYDKLSSDLKSKIDEFTKRDKIPADWLSRLIQKSMVGNNFSSHVNQVLSTIASGGYDSFEGQVLAEIDDSFLYEDSFYFGAYMYHNISCQELSLAENGSAGSYFLKQDKFVPNMAGSKSVCIQIPGMVNRISKATYYATNYPLHSKVTYFQGLEDGATGSNNAVRHFTNVAKGDADLVEMPENGHGPVLSCLSISKYDPNPFKCKNLDKIVAMVELALKGKRLEKELVLSINPSWKMQSH